MENVIDYGEILERFAIYGDFVFAKPFGAGHINSTFVSTWNQAGARVRYLHQRINDAIFHNPSEIMENILRVTEHIARKNALSGAIDKTDLSRHVLTVIRAKDGKLFVRDSSGAYWRTYLFIENSRSLEVAQTPKEAEFLGASVAHFHNLLSDLPSPPLHDSIPDFHNMEMRYGQFYAALNKDVKNRAKEVKAEIEFFEKNEERGGILIRALKSGKLPVHICHNDTKMNNILIDSQSSEALCLVDLDIVMSGTILFDTGDLIRTVCATATEDETDLTKVAFSPVFFENLVKGYLSGAHFITANELELLVESGRNLTHIMGLRFLTDYLAGDTYYQIARPSHNIDRSRNQIALVNSMDAQWEPALSAVEKCCKM